MNQKYRTLQTYVVWGIDMVCILVSYLIATYIRYNSRNDWGDKTLHYMVCVVFLLFCVIYTFLADWNRDFITRGYMKELGSVLRSVGFITLGSLVVIFFLQWTPILSRFVVGNFIWMNILLTYVARIIFKGILRRHISNDNNVTRVVVISERELMEKTVRTLLKKSSGLGYRIVRAYCANEKDRINSSEIAEDANSDERKTGKERDKSAFSHEVNAAETKTAESKKKEGWYIGSVRVHFGLQDLTSRLVTAPFDEVFINTPHISQNELADMIRGFEEMGVTTHYSLELPSISKASTQVGEFMDYSVITYNMNRTSYKRLFIKRIIDIIGGAVGLILTCIITIFLAPAIKLDSPGPVFFSQIRVGKNGRRFKIYKFRSMYVDAEERKKELEAQNEMNGLMFKMENDPRVTKVGAFIRKTSLDEFPQFLNVLKGEMSLVGTRPPTEQEFLKYNEHYRRRLSMTPGLTGLWQISGRSDIMDFDEVVKLDLQYIDNWNLTEDFKILFKTVGVVLFGKGAK